jgi:hypothetical protein
VEGVRGRREKNLGALWVVSRLSRIAFAFALKSQAEIDPKNKLLSCSQLGPTSNGYLTHAHKLEQAPTTGIF